MCNNGSIAAPYDIHKGLPALTDIRIIFQKFHPFNETRLKWCDGTEVILITHMRSSSSTSSLHSIFLPNTCTSSFLASFLPHSLFTSIHGMCWESDRNAYHRQWIYDGRRRIHHQPEEVDNLIQWNSHSGSPKTHVVQHAAYLKTFFPSIFSKIP